MIQLGQVSSRTVEAGSVLEYGKQVTSQQAGRTVTGGIKTAPGRSTGHHVEHKRRLYAIMGAIPEEFR